MSQIWTDDGGSPLPNIELLEGNSGGAVGPNGSNITFLLGADGIDVAGNPGTNTLTITPDGTLATSYPTNSGTAVPAAGVLNVLGGTGCSTSGAGNTVTINIDAESPLSFSTDSGTATPAANSLNVFGGGGTSTSGSGSTITITSTGGGIDWVDVTGTTQAMAINTGYSANNAALVTLTLPATASFGDVIRVAGYGAGGWRIAQNAGQTIHYNSTDTTTGTGGRISSNNRYNTMELLCSVASTDWVVLSSSGNFTIV